jgi:UDP-N-acetylmuramoyl-tripeptide--D-alanyl-D-alanine ligase
MTALVFVALVASAGALAGRNYRALHMFQLDSYIASRYLRHSLRTGVRPGLLWTAAYVLGVAVSGVLVIRDFSAPGVVAAALWLVGMAVVGWRTWTKPTKKRIVVTKRVYRLMLCICVLVVGMGTGLGFAVLHFSKAGGSGALCVWAAFSLAGLLSLGSPLFVVASSMLLAPYESHVRNHFISAAKRRLSEARPLVIGVAGSYGKTTTKYAVAKILSSQFRVVSSPESYNTLLGATRTVNERLTDDAEVLVLEMGARHEGDIQEICDFAQPSIGVVTRLGPQHLEYFKTQESVVRAKTELVRALPPDGLAVVDSDGLCDFTVMETSARIIRVSARDGADAEVRLDGISIGREGTSFRLTWRDGSRIIHAQTPLLGRHAASNCAVAAVLAAEIGVPEADIVQGLRELSPVPHRLEIIRNDVVTVIDDAFNSNPDGFESALEVLASLEGRRIVVTPGMVELGKESVPAHRRIGEQMGKVANIVVLVGNSYPEEFVAAIREAGLPEDCLEQYDSLALATERLSKLVEPGDVVLFENDLPDNFR